MQYTFTCPMKGCTHTEIVEASTDVEAREKLFDMAKGHGKNTHSDIEMSDEEVTEIVDKNTKQNELV